MTSPQWSALNRSTRALLVLFLLAGSFAVGQSPESGKPTTIYLVRHAEKQEPASNPDTDTPLNTEGQARAAKLAKLLSGCSIAVAYTTPFKRTIDTAMPLVERKQLAGSPVQTNPRDMASLLDQIQKLDGKNALVVGHSNTTPAVARALAGRQGAVPDIADPAYDNLFVVTVTRWEPREASVKHYRYGKASAGSDSSPLPEFSGCKN